MVNDVSFRTMPGPQVEKAGISIGDTLLNGRYTVLAELGRGGMGIVFKCLDTLGKVNVALKCLPPELSHNAAEMEDIRNNFALVQRLNQSNIANIKHLEYDTLTGDYYLIMECVEGESLRTWMRRKQQTGELTIEEALPILRQIAEALDYAHAQKIIHRDIKPGNVMLEADGTVKVLDFGLAAQIHTSMTYVSMAYQSPSGTAPYMAPEQWRGRRQGAPADQYALGVLAYEMFAGHLPFESADSMVLKQAVLEETAEPIRTIPHAAQVAIARAMSKQPEERFATCLEFVDALAGKKVAKAKRVKVQHHRTSSGSPMKAIAAVGVILLALAGGVFVALDPLGLFQGKSSPVVQKKAFEIPTDPAVLAQKTYRLLSRVETRKSTIDSSSYDRGQGFGARVDAFNESYSAGKLALQNKDLTTAYTCLMEADLAATWIFDNAPLRDRASQLLGTVATKQEAADTYEAVTLAAVTYKTAQTAIEQGRKAYEAAEFATALPEIEKGLNAYGQAAVEARAAKVKHLIDEATRLQGEKNWVALKQLAEQLKPLEEAQAQGFITLADQSIRDEAIAACLAKADAAKQAKQWNELKTIAEALKPWDVKQAAELVVFAERAIREEAIAECLELAEKSKQAKAWNELKLVAKKLESLDSAKAQELTSLADRSIREEAIAECLAKVDAAKQAEDWDALITAAEALKALDEAQAKPLLLFANQKILAKKLGPHLVKAEAAKQAKDWDALRASIAELQTIDEVSAKIYQTYIDLFTHGKSAEKQQVVLDTLTRAQAGDAQAQCDIGKMYDDGFLVSKSFENAFAWYQRAATQGNAEAQYRLGHYYSSGVGRSVDYKEAFKWNMKAAEQGYVWALSAARDDYKEGYGVEPSRSEAKKWNQRYLEALRKAAEAGDPRAQKELAWRYRSGTDLPRSKGNADKWYKKAFDVYSQRAQAGDMDAQHCLADCYASGEGVAKDKRKALQLYLQLAEQGYEPAYEKIDDVWFYGLKKHEADVWKEKAHAVLLRDATLGSVSDMLSLVVYYGDKDLANAIEWQKKAAEMGNRDSQRALAERYRSGVGIPQSYTDAAKWYRRAADAGDSVAQYVMGSLYQLGEGVPQSLSEAKKWKTKASLDLVKMAESGDAEAQRDLAFQHIFNDTCVDQDEAEFRKWMKAAAAQEFVPAMVSLANYYGYGWYGLERSDSIAAQWYLKAANFGDEDAQFHLAELYRDGKGVPQSYNEAVKWFSKIIAEGSGYRVSFAKRNLSKLYSEGKGVPRSTSTAKRLMDEVLEEDLLAANAGDVSAQKTLARGAHSDEDYTTAMKWYRMAAEQGDAEAQGEIGEFYDLGRGVQENDYEALRWYLKAAEQGYVGAYIDVAQCYWFGNGVTKSIPTALEWYKKAAMAENGGWAACYAQRYLGERYRDGEDGVPKNRTESIKWFRMAARNGDEEARKELKVMGETW